MKRLFHKFISWSTPGWRLATLFLWWGTLHLCMMVFLVWTNLEQIIHGRAIVLLAVLLATGLFLLLSHIGGLAFRPLRGLRISLWIVSFLMLGIWAAMPFIASGLFDIHYRELQWSEPDTAWGIVYLKYTLGEILKAFCHLQDVSEPYIKELEPVFGRLWLFIAFLLQVAADGLHCACEWRVAKGDVRLKVRHGIVVGTCFALLPLASILCPVLLGHFQWKACEAYGKELRKIREAPSQDASKREYDDFMKFKKTEEELTNSWKAGRHSEVLAQWEALAQETKSKSWLEKRRLRLLPHLLCNGIPGDASLCKRIVSALQEAQNAMKPLERDSILWNNDVRRQAFMESGPFGEDEPFAAIIAVFFKHYKKPLASVPAGLERYWETRLLRQTDVFYQLKLRALDTPLEKMGELEADFDRWLASMPWNYEVFAPNQKCLDGVGVHINRYADLYGMQYWQATCREAIVGIAVHQYRLAHHQWPATLELLVPSFLPELPCDPFTNGPLKIASHPKYKDAVSIYAERKTGDDSSPDDIIRIGFPVSLEYPLRSKEKPENKNPNQQ